MKLSAPTNLFFYVSLALAVIGLIGRFAVAALAPYGFWLLLLGYVLLVIGVVMKNA